GGKDPIDDVLGQLRTVGLEKRAAEQVGKGAIVAQLSLPRRQEVDDVLEAAGLQVAVAQHDAGSLVCAVGLEGLFQVGNGLGQSSGLVVGQRQIDAKRDVVRLDGEGALVVRKGVLVTAQARERGSEIRASRRVVRLQAERVLIRLDGTE